MFHHRLAYSALFLSLSFLLHHAPQVSHAMKLNNDPVQQFTLDLAKSWGPDSPAYLQYWWKRRHREDLERLKKLCAHRDGFDGLDTMLVGDSVVKGWSTVGKDVLKAAFGSRSTSTGLNGDTVENLEYRLAHGLAEQIKECRPRELYLAIGHNDFGVRKANVSDVSMRLGPLTKKLLQLLVDMDGKTGDDPTRTREHRTLVLQTLTPRGDSAEMPITNHRSKVNAKVLWSDPHAGACEGKKDCVSSSGGFLLDNAVGRKLGLSKGTCAPSCAEYHNSITEYGRRMKTLVDELDKIGSVEVRFVDCTQSVLSKDGEVTQDYYSQDFLHPNAAGYELLAQCLTKEREEARTTSQLGEEK